MPATHNALLGALSRFSHLSEFTENLNVRGTVMTPAQRRNLALQNLVGGSGTFISENGVMRLPNNKLAVTAGTGITGGVGTVFKEAVSEIGNIVYTDILIDLTGLSAVATDGDIIGQGAVPAHLGQNTLARNGTPFAGTVTCLEVPAGGSADIDVYLASVATGVLDGAISGLSGQAQLLNQGGNWTLALFKALSDPAALTDKYLYLTNGAAAGAGAYTAGKFLISILGYR